MLVVELRILIAADILEIYVGAAAGVGRKRPLGNGLVLKGELTAVAAGALHHVQLLDLAEPGCDQQLPLGRKA
jgi:hypothetical protein